MTNEKHIELEQRIVRKYIKACVDAGHAPKLMNTGDETFRYNAANLFEADECQLTLHNGGWLYFVYGNEPGEVLADYTTNLESIVGPVNKWAEQYA